MKMKNVKLLAIPIATLLVFGFYYFDLSIEVKRAWAQVQQNVGGYTFVPSTVASGPRWMRDCATISPTADGEATTLFTNAPNDCTVKDVDAIMHIFNGTSFDRLRGGAVGSGITATGLGSTTLMLSAPGALFNQWIDVSGSGDAVASNIGGVGNYIFDGATWARQRNIADGGSALGVIASMPALAIGATGAAGFNRQREASANALTQTTALGIPPVVAYATWACTSAPAAANQATCSQAAGGGTVRHVVTAFQMCLFTATVAVIPVAQVAVVRDGATGAGTIFFNSVAGSGTAQGGQCQNSPPGYTRIGTANTAMTVEFAAAPPANVLQTVNMSGYSVP